jgi:hypothetical protein
MADSLSAPDYIRGNFQPADRIAILLRSRNRGDVIQRITTAEKIASPEFQAWLAFKNLEGFDIYIGMNTLKPGAYSRTKQDIETIRHLYADLDYDGLRALAAIQNSELVPKPNFVLETSPGKYQVVWKVQGIKPEEAENVQQAIAYEFGADLAATDSARVLRLPSFANKKYDEEFPVTAHLQTTQMYHAWHFKLRTPAVEPNGRSIRPDNPPARSPTTHRNPNAIGRMRNAPLRAAMTLKKSFAASPTIAPTKKTIPNTTPATPSRKHRLSFRRNQSTPLSPKTL